MLDKLELSKRGVRIDGGEVVHLVKNKVEAIIGKWRFPVVALTNDGEWIIVKKDEGACWADKALGPDKYFFINIKRVRFEVEPGCLTE